MFLENQPDDLIQCLVPGAFNSKKEIQTNLKQVPTQTAGSDPPLGTWRELQGFVLDQRIVFSLQALVIRHARPLPAARGG